MRFPLAVVLVATVLDAAQLSLPYSVTVVAGGTNVGDGGFATNASLADAEGVAVDSAGNFYVVDTAGDRVRMITPSGIISTLAVSLSSPYGVTVDGRGNIYVADLGNNRIQKIASDGVVTTVLSRLAMPRNVLADGTGNVYFSEFAGNRVSKIGRDGSVSLVAGTGLPGANGNGGPAMAAQLNHPAGLALDSLGNLYIADSGNGSIRKISAGRISTVVSGTDIATPTAVAVDGVGNLYVADTGNRRIRKVTVYGTVSTIPQAARDLALDDGGNLLVAYEAHVYRVLSSGAVTTIAGDGGYLSRGDGGPATMARLNAPSGVAVDSNGNLWIADTANGRIRMVTTTSGQINFAAGGGQLVTPNQIAFDPAGNLLISDAAGYRVREWTALAGNLFTVAGNGLLAPVEDGFPATATGLVTPGGVAVGANGTIYISDTGNHRVRRVISGVMITVAGNGAKGFNGDGPGQAVSLNSPNGLCVDPAGNVYIADTGNNRIRAVSPDGVVKTIAGPDQLNAPRGVAIDAARNLWIADTGNHRVVVLPPGGALVVVADQLQAPWALAVDPVSGGIYVTDAGSNLVLLLGPGPAALLEVPTPLTVVNAATLMPGPVAPGSLISIFGAGLASAQVLFDDQPAQLQLAQDTRINTVLPLGATGNIQVAVGKTILLNSMLKVAPGAPGVFTVAGGTGPVVATNQDGSMNSNLAPAAQGSVVAIYGTGLGQALVGASIGGATAQVLFAGDAPGFVGVSQINVRVPLGIASGTAALVVSAGPAQSQSGVSLYVQ
jgi:uncharacterized protein (TIGR03437 family)